MRIATLGRLALIATLGVSACALESSGLDPTELYGAFGESVAADAGLPNRGTSTLSLSACDVPDSRSLQTAERVAGRPVCRGARVIEAVPRGAEESVPHYACVWAPEVQSKPLATWVYLHGADRGPSDALRSLRERDTLGASVVIAPQARAFGDGPGHGTRTMRFDASHVSSSNQDVQWVRTVLAQLIEEGIVAAEQVILVGESGAGAFAELVARAMPRAFSGIWMQGQVLPATGACDHVMPPAVFTASACDAERALCGDVERWLRVGRGPRSALWFDDHGKPAESCEMLRCEAERKPIVGGPSAPQIVAEIQRLAADDAAKTAEHGAEGRAMGYDAGRGRQD